jgi:hypothetical protein
MSSPIFTRRHYEAIAGLVRDAGYLEPEARGRLVSELCELFAGDNDRVQPDRFRAATYNGVRLDAASEPVTTCTTCGRQANDGYVNEAAGERCVDAVHDAYSPAGAAARRARQAWARTQDQLELSIAEEVAIMLARVSV